MSGGSDERGDERQEGVTWWVRLGSERSGPWPVERVAAQRSADLFSRWHEVSVDGRSWRGIDEALAALAVGELASGAAADLALGLDGSQADPVGGGASVDWSVMGDASGAGGSTRDAEDALSVWRGSALCVAMWAAAGLWGLLVAVPLGWWEGERFYAWGWPSDLAGGGLAVAVGWWGLVAALVGLLAWRPGWGKFQERFEPWLSWRVVFGVMGLVGWLFLVVGGPGVCRLVGGLVWVPWAVMGWWVWGGFSGNWRRGALATAGAWAGLLVVAWCWGDALYGRGPIEGSSLEAAEALALSVSARLHGVLSAVLLLTHGGLLALVCGLGAGSRSLDSNGLEASDV